MSTCPNCFAQLSVDFLDMVMNEMEENQNLSYKIQYDCSFCHKRITFEKELGCYYLINGNNREMIGAR